jgi:protein-S-isoprenylcysteine O-methyltransferase Ste14
MRLPTTREREMTIADPGTSSRRVDTVGALSDLPTPHSKSEAATAPARSCRVVLGLRVSANIIAAGGAALFARAGLHYYLDTHSLIGAAFFAEQMWIVVAYLVRRPARVVSQRPLDWLLAFGGTFAGVLLRPDGAHPHWGVVAGFDAQVIGLAICVASFFALGRSFGFAAADRGLVRRGPYSLVRHPIYASYFFLQFGYLLQSLSLRNALVVVFVCSCNVARALVEEQLLVTSTRYEEYRCHVRWRLVPGIW